MDYPGIYKTELANCPPSDRHKWLLKVANYAVFAGRTQEQAAAEIHAALTRPPNPRNEVESAVEKAFRDHADWKLSGGATVGEVHGVKALSAPKEARVDDDEASPEAFAALAGEGEGATSDLWRAASPVDLSGVGAEARQYLFVLQNCYTGEEFVCGGGVSATGPRKVSDILADLERGATSPEFHCANPLTGAAAPTKSGGLSTRCDAAVSAFRYVVAEMDGATLEEQARFWWGWQRKIQGIKIAALIYTGGKSIHAWLRVDAADAEEWAREVRGRLFPKALTPLGCDPTCKNASRLTRAPGHFREDKRKWQTLLFLDTWEGARRKVPLKEAVDEAVRFVEAHRPAAETGDLDPVRKDALARMKEAVESAGGTLKVEINAGVAPASPGAKKKGRPTDRERAMPLAEEFIGKTAVDGTTTWRKHHDVWHHWIDGAWNVENGEGELFADVMAFLQEKLKERATHGLARAIMLQMASATMCHVPAKLEAPCWLPGGEDGRGWVCMGDELIDISGLARGLPMDECRRETTPALFSTLKVGYKFDPKADCPTFKKYLADVFPDEEDRKMALWALACALGGLKRYEVFFFLYGDGGTGKTVYTTVLKGLLGEKNVSSLDLMDLDEKHAQHVLAEARANVTSELPANMNRSDLGRVEAALKRVVSGEEIKVEHKGLEPYFAKATAILFFASNSMPIWVDKTNGLRRRQRCIAFLHNQSERPDVDRELVPKLLGELPGIFNLVVESLRDLTANHPSAFPDVGNGARILAEHLAECDVERTFLEGAYEVAPGETTVTGRAIYEAYKAYCDENGYRAKGANLFAGDIRRVFPGATKSQLRLDGGRNVYWVGLHKILFVEPDDVNF